MSTSDAVPRAGEVFEYAQREIHRAATDLWPGTVVRLDEHVPSVTGYVLRVSVGDRVLFAKYSFLGVSLVSLLRGVYGGWPQVQQAQASYVLQADSLPARETAQLRFLGELGRPKVCVVAGMGRGVMFTEPVGGPTLAGLLLACSHDTAELMESAYGELGGLHRHHSTRSLSPYGVIRERSIPGTFRRKFGGTVGARYVNELRARPGSPAGHELAFVLGQVVARLQRRAALPQTGERSVLVYGELKPEHVLFPDGPGARPVFIDPGLLRARAAVDTAKLISRTVLLLAAYRPGHEAARQVSEGLAAFADTQMRSLPGAETREWLHELVVLWLMDTVNILITYLAAPSGLPLPVQGQELVRRAAVVLAMVDAVSSAWPQTPKGRGMTLSA